jgi:8-oxo-dGTP diphosphatase
VKRRGDHGGGNGERRFLARYRPDAYARPSVTVDVVILTIVDAELRVLLVRRDQPPFRRAWALPGGFVRVGDGRRDQGEDLDDAARRELAEEAGLDAAPLYLEQLGAFGRPRRDPRMRVITVAYYALVPPDLVPLVRAGGDAGDVRWFAARGGGRPRLAFDHDAILLRALERIVERIDVSELMFHLVPRTFTIPELRAVREIVTARKQDPGNFRRRVQRMIEDGVIERAPGRRITGSKPATVYRFVTPAASRRASSRTLV